VKAPGTLALALAVAVAGCSTAVLHDVDERSANEVLSALERAGIAADKAPDESAAGSGAPSFTVRVARGDGARALELLRALGLPHDRRRGFAETYAQPSLIPTASEERARYLDALAGEIERTLESADGVVSARVHLVLEAADPLADPAAEPAAEGARRGGGARAAVLLKARGGRAPLGERDVQKLVAGSVPGLDPDAVAVVVTPGPEPVLAGERLAALGPLRLTPASRSLLVGLLAVALATVAVLALLLLVTARRLAAHERASDQPPASR
jgi:type III secretion protein J